MTLDQFLASKNFSEAIGLPLDGAFHRFDRGGSLNGWFRGSTLKVGEKALILAVFGDWRTDEKFSYKDAGAGALSPDEEKALELEAKKALDAERYARKKNQEEVAAKCEEEWAGAITRGRTPYMERKQIGDLYGARICPQYPDTLLVPMRDIDGKLWGIQRILPKKLDNGLDKLFTKHQRISGCFHTMGEISPSGDCYVAEGYATAASIHQSTGQPTVVAFNAGNLAAVGEALRARYPHLALIFCGDDDRWTQRPDGTPWNPGKTAATDAARMLHSPEGRAEARLPVFPSLDTRPTDFNDLHCLSGILAVKEQLLAPLAPAKVRAEWAQGLVPLEWGVSKRGSPVPPDHQKVADALASYYGERICRQGEDIFVYTGNHWHHMKKDETPLFYNQLNYLYSDKGTSGQVESFYKLFLHRLPRTSLNLFAPDPRRVNFLDGTLHWEREPGNYSRWRSSFRPHNLTDYVTHVVPLEYGRAKNPDGTWKRSKEFEDMLARVFQGDPDISQKIRAVRQMYGACLAPIKPHLFLLHGPQGSGKSSLIIPAMRLVHHDNWCSVQPHELKGFLMDSMAGKLVNFCTDLSLTEPISDSAIKTIEDRVPVRIDRKFQESIKAPLPAVHIFGANGIPPTLDASSGAHRRRWTFIKLDAHKTVPGEYMHDFGNWVFDQDPYGVLAFALQGMEDLFQVGHYTVPDSGLRDMDNWSLENDPVAAFLDEARNGGIPYNQGQLIVDDKARIRPNELWESFLNFAQKSWTHRIRMGKIQFYARVEGAGFRRIKSKEIKFSGLGAIENCPNNETAPENAPDFS